MVQLNPVAAPALLALVVGWALAAVVFVTRPARRQNRRLALLLFIEATAWGAGAGVLFLVEDPATGYGIQAVFHMSLLALPWLYLRFLATLDVPLTRPLRNRTSEALLVVASMGAPLVYLLRPGKYTVAMVEAWYTPVEAVLGPWFDYTLLLVGAASLYGLAAAINGVRAAGEGPARDRARSYAIAFGVCDAILVSIVMVLPTVVPPPPTGSWTDLLYIWGSPVSTLAFALLASYGILRTQLFGIDLKIKRGISRSTVAGTFGALFLVVSEGVEFLLGVEGTLYGVGAAVLVGLFFRRVEAAAQDVADVLMPGVEDTEEYREQRKLQVYRDAVEDAAGDEEVTEKERDVLDGLRENLGLDADVANSLERDVLGARGGDA